MSKNKCRQCYREYDPVMGHNCQAAMIKGFDPVAKPEHYASGGIECIDAIQASMSAEEFKGYLKGNAQKYLWRYQNKANPAQDLAKAQWYLNRLAGLVNNKAASRETQG